MTLDVRTTTEYSAHTSTVSSMPDAKKPVNSVMTAAASQNKSTSETNHASKIDELLEKLCVELQKFGIKPEDIKNSGILYRISGMNEKQIESLEESKLKTIFDCLKNAIVETAADGKVDLEQVGKTANKYYIALQTGWDSIDKYKKNQNGESLSARMERFFGLDKKGIKFADLPPDKVEDYLRRYFNDFFIGKLKNAKTQNEKQKIYKQQLQDFGKLLNNTPDNEKAVFKQAITSLVASNRIKGLDAVLVSFDTTEARTEWADSWTVDEKENLMNGSDVEGNTLSQEEGTLAFVKIQAEMSEESIKEQQAENHPLAKGFFEENKEKLEKIAQKEANGVALTDEEKALKAKKEFFIALASGSILGTANNDNISADAKTELLNLMNANAYELTDYEEVLNQINKVIEEHPEVLNMPKEDVEKLLDKATNGNYAIVASGSGTELKAPVSSSTHEDVSSVPDIGFTQRTTSIDPTPLEVLRQNLTATTNERQSFKIKKTKTNPITTSNNVVDAIKETSSLSSALKQLGDSNLWNMPFVRDIVSNSIAHLTNPLQILNTLPSSMIKDIAPALIKKGKLNKEDIDKLNISIADKNILTEIYNNAQKEEC